MVSVYLIYPRTPIYLIIAALLIVKIAELIVQLIVEKKYVFGILVKIIVSLEKAIDNPPGAFITGFIKGWKEFRL
jgi:hypothetical protein